MNSVSRLSISTLLEQDWKSTYQAIQDLERLSKLIVGIEKVSMQPISPSRRLSEWVIHTDGFRITWKEENQLIRRKGLIKFRMLEGPFEYYEGQWQVSPAGPEKAKVTFSADIGWGKLLDIGEPEDELDRKVRVAVRWMLAKLRKQSEFLPYNGETTKKALPDQIIVSEFFTCQNLKGKRIVGVYDHLRQVGPGGPVVVIAPGYGETKRDSLTLAYYLAQNGFRVLRYDATDHVGESDGDIFSTTLPKMKGDLISILDFMETRFRARSCAVIAGSLSARVAIRAAVEDPRVSLLVSLVGVVDVRATLKTVYYRDIIGAFLENQGWDVADILGFEVSRTFPETAIQDKYHDLSTTVEEVRKLKVPLIFLIAEKDAWVRLEDVRAVFEASVHGGGELHIIPGTMHRIYENPRSTRLVLKQLVSSCKKHLISSAQGMEEVKEPSTRELVTQNKIERNRLHTLRKTSQEQESRFWDQYLSKYLLITKSHDFRNLLSLVDLMLGSPQDGEYVLDAGCGNGHYGAWLLWSIAAKIKEIPQNNGALRIFPRNYIGLDFAPKAVEEATVHLNSMEKEISTSIGIHTGLRFAFILADLNYRLPFPDSLFEKICCNLVISYVEHAKATMRELMRVLKPNGRLVVTSLKPFADLSQIYRNFVVQVNNEQEIDEARRLLSSAGRIHQKEVEGLYRFFSEGALRALVARSGGSNIRSFQVFGDQAFLVACSKQNGAAKRDIFRA